MLFSLFIILVVAFCIALGYFLFTRKGKDTQISFLYGGKVTRDLGILVDTRTIATGASESIRILQCENSSEPFYVLEATQKHMGSITVHWMKLTPSEVQKLYKLTQNT